MAASRWYHQHDSSKLHSDSKRYGPGQYQRTGYTACRKRPTDRFVEGDLAFSPQSFLSLAYGITSEDECSWRVRPRQPSRSAVLPNCNCVELWVIWLQLKCLRQRFQSYHHLGHNELEHYGIGFGLSIHAGNLLYWLAEIVAFVNARGTLLSVFEPRVAPRRPQCSPSLPSHWRQVLLPSVDSVEDDDMWLYCHEKPYLAWELCFSIATGPSSCLIAEGRLDGRGGGCRSNAWMLSREEERKNQDGGD